MQLMHTRRRCGSSCETRWERRERDRAVLCCVLCVLRISVSLGSLQQRHSDGPGASAARLRLSLACSREHVYAVRSPRGRSHCQVATLKLCAQYAADAQATWRIDTICTYYRPSPTTRRSSSPPFVIRCLSLKLTGSVPIDLFTLRLPPGGVFETGFATTQSNEQVKS